MRAISATGTKSRKTPIKNSISKSKITIRRDTEIRTDLMHIPKIIENNTNPCLYSFLSGLKKVLIRRGRDSNEATYRLRSIKKSSNPPRTSLYQKAIK